MKKSNKYICCLFISLIITCIVVIVDVLGVDFLALRLVQFPFASSRNIDNLSDYYTVLWEGKKRNPIDNETFAIIDVTENDRGQIAQIVTKISEMKPKIIGLDVDFISLDDKINDSQLVSSIQAIPNIVLPVELSKDNKNLLPGIFDEKWEYKQFGVVSFPNTKNVLRTYSPIFYLPNDTINAFGCVIAENYGVDISNLRNKKQLLINYTTLHSTSLSAIPGNDFLNVNPRDSSFLSTHITNRIVLIGTQDAEDSHLTPLGYYMPGVMIHAHIINSIIENKNISAIPSCLKYIFCWVLSFLLLCWYTYKGYQNLPMKTNKWINLSISIVVYFISLIFFAWVGTNILGKYSYYIDFAPYVVTLILVYILKDKTNLVICKK